MASISLSHSTFFRKTKTSSFFRPSQYCRRNLNMNLQAAASKHCLSSKTGLQVVAACSGKDAAGEEDNNTAMETVFKLYTGIRNKDINVLSELFGEECSCICNFVSSFQPFYGKKQVMNFFSFLIKFLGDHIEFVVQPTSQNGMSVGVSWKLECSKTHVSLGKGFSLHTCHNYQGKILIKNMDMFIEPLFHIEHLRLKIMSLLANTIEEITKALYQDKARATLNILFTFLLVVLLLILFRHPKHSLRLILRSKQ